MGPSTAGWPSQERSTPTPRPRFTWNGDCFADDHERARPPPLPLICTRHAAVHAVRLTRRPLQAGCRPQGWRRTVPPGLSPKTVPDVIARRALGAGTPGSSVSTAVVTSAGSPRQQGRHVSGVAMSAGSPCHRGGHLSGVTMSPWSLRHPAPRTPMASSVRRQGISTPSARQPRATLRIYFLPTQSGPEPTLRICLVPAQSVDEIGLAPSSLSSVACSRSHGIGRDDVVSRGTEHRPVCGSTRTPCGKAATFRVKRCRPPPSLRTANLRQPRLMTPKAQRTEGRGPSPAHPLWPPTPNAVPVPCRSRAAPPAPTSINRCPPPRRSAPAAMVVTKPPTSLKSAPRQARNAHSPEDHASSTAAEQWTDRRGSGASLVLRPTAMGHLPGVRGELRPANTSPRPHGLRRHPRTDAPTHRRQDNHDRQTPRTALSGQDRRAHRPRNHRSAPCSEHRPRHLPIHRASDPRRSTAARTSSSEAHTHEAGPALDQP